MASYNTIEVDTTSGTDIGSVSNFSFNHTVGSGNDGILILIHKTRGTNVYISSATFNGKAMTLGYKTGLYDTCRVEFWYILEPDAGTHSISVTLNEASNDRHCAGAVSFFNVEQDSPIKITDYQTGNATSFSNSFTSTLNGQYVIEAQSNTGSAAGTQSAGQTLIYKRSTANSGGMSYKSLGTSGSESVGWSGFASGSAYNSGLIVIQPSLKKKAFNRGYII